MRYDYILNRLAHIIIALAIAFVGAGILVMDTIIIIWGIERMSSQAAWIGISVLLLFVTTLGIAIDAWFIVWAMDKIPDVESIEKIPTPYQSVK